MEAETGCETQSYLERKPLVNPLGDTLAVVEADSFADTPGDMEAKGLLNACAIVLLRCRPQQIVTYLEILRSRH